jgi:D-alanine-D-alanine ligase
MKKLRVAILFGGHSGEHEVSLLSAASVLNAIDKKKYEVVPTGITKEGRWLTAEHAENLLQGKLVMEPRDLRAGDPETTPAAAMLAQGESVIVPPAPVHRQNGLMPFQSNAALARQRLRHQCRCALPSASRHLWTKGIFGRSTVFADHRFGAIL